ncbi:MAG TPA: GAF domain-containing sensor histidine kinase, partial [Candidatus Thermoplasmatota archaeon]|nr:GAF domain-containing sensor histidine kinase [Candidatus Thermoplasmatota archaeon]
MSVTAPGAPTPRMHLVDPLIQETRAFASGMEAALGHREAAVVDAVAAYAARHEHGLRIVGDYETLRDLALGTMPIDERLAALLQGTRALLDAKVAAVLLLDEQGHELWPRVSSGFETPVGVSPMPVNGRIRKVVADAQPIVIDEVGTQEPFDQRLRREGVQSAVVVPLTVGSKVEGAVLCAHPGTGRFTERDVTLLGLVAHRMGVGLDRGRILDAQVRRRETAEAQSQFRKTLLHMATHDLKTPLTAIGMQLHLMAAPEVPEAQRRKAMAMVQRNVKRLGEMLDDFFLDLARIEAGRLTLTPTEFDAVALLRECAEVFEAQALQKGLRIEVSAPDSLMAYGDPRRVAQVL